jgi:hypothetical protein
MSSQNLASLVVIRNHLHLLLTTDRVLITKDKVRVYEALRSKIDKMFLEQTLNTFGTDTLAVTTKHPNGTSSGIVVKSTGDIAITGDIVVFDPNGESKEQQLSLGLDKLSDPVKVDDNLLTSADKPAKRNGSSKVEIPTSEAEAKEIAAKVASAKKELKAKKNGGKGKTFKRNLDEVAEDE